ncbi:MAG: hypothetical protein WC455_11370 [Dehalococcoidia bacterium]|jgi:hypothetical protein
MGEAFKKTVHYSDDGVSLVEADDYAAMRTALGLDTFLGPFVSHPSNPLLTVTGDELHKTFASIVYDDGVYYAFYSYYSNYSGGVYSIGLATSTDGVTFEEYASNPIFTPSGSGFGSTSRGVARVWTEDGVWHMLFRGNSATAGVDDDTGYASASAPTGTWAESAANTPVLTHGTAGAWDEYGAECWAVWRVGDTLYTFYEAKVGNVSTARAIGLATASASDPTTWTKSASNPIFTGGRFCPDVFYFRGIWWAIVPHYGYEAAGANHAVLELWKCTTPNDFETWEWCGIIKHTSQSGFDSDDLDTPYILTDDIYRNTYTVTGDELWLYHDGQSGSTRQMGLAICRALPGDWVTHDNYGYGYLPVNELDAAYIDVSQDATILGRLAVGVATTTDKFEVYYAGAVNGRIWGNGGLTRFTIGSRRPDRVWNFEALAFTAENGYAFAIDCQCSTYAGPLIFRQLGTDVARVEKTGELTVISDVVGIKLDSAGTTTISSNGTRVAINKALQIGGDLDANGHTIHFGTAENEATIATGTNPNTCTVDLQAGNHWTIPANDANNPINATITMPPGPCGGTIFIEQGATPRDITWLPAESVVWLGTEPTWTDASEASEFHGISWRFNGTYVFLSDAGKTSIA